jgi:hypothetical protein
MVVDDLADFGIRRIQERRDPFNGNVFCLPADGKRDRQFKALTDLQKSSPNA